MSRGKRGWSRSFAPGVTVLLPQGVFKVKLSRLDFHFSSLIQNKWTDELLLHSSCYRVISWWVNAGEGRSLVLGEFAGDLVHLPGLNHHGRGLVQQLGLMICVEGSGIGHVVQNITAYQSVPEGREVFSGRQVWAAGRHPFTTKSHCNWCRKCLDIVLLK